MPRVRLVLAVAFVLLSCSPTKPRVGGTRAPTKPAVARSAALDALADRLDPGPQQPLSADMPDSIAKSLGVAPNVPVASAVLDLSGQWSAWTASTQATDEDRIASILSMARAATQLERGLADAPPDVRVDALFALAPIYALFDAPLFARDWAHFSSFGGLLEQVLARNGAPPTAAVELWTFASKAIPRAAAAHRRALAELLRTAPTDQRLPDAIERGARSIGTRDSDLAIDLARVAVERRGAAAKAAHWYTLAHECYRGLDPECGDEALARAWKAGGADEPDMAKRIEGAVTLGEKARRVLALTGAKEVGGIGANAPPELVEGLERARLLNELGRTEDAIAAWDALANAYPNDARVITGLADAQIIRTFDFSAAVALLDRLPRPPEHADRRFWELAVGARATWLTASVLPKIAGGNPDALFRELRPELDKLAVDIRGLESTGADTGIVLRYLVDRGLEAIPLVVAGNVPLLVAIARRALPDAVAIAARVPDSLHAYRLVLAGTSFSGDRDATFRALAELPAFARPREQQAGATPPPPPTKRDVEIAALRFQRLRAWLDAAIVWADEEQVELLQRELFTGDGITFEHQLLFVESLALLARLRDTKEQWPDVASTFEGFASSVPPDRQARLLVNAGVAQIEAGQAMQGEALLRRALEGGGEAGELARLNLVAAGVAGVGLDGLTSSKHIETRVLALGLAVAAARGPERKRLQDQFRTARAQQCRERVRARALPGEAGVILRGSINFQLGFSTVDGLKLELVTTSEGWLLVRSAYAAVLRDRCPGDRPRPKPKRGSTVQPLL